MKTKEVVKYICEHCGNESEDVKEIEKCEKKCSIDVYPVVLLNESIQEKLKTHNIVKFRLQALDDTGELACIVLVFSDNETFEIAPPFYPDNLDIY